MKKNFKLEEKLKEYNASAKSGFEVGCGIYHASVRFVRGQNGDCDDAFNDVLASARQVVYAAKDRETGIAAFCLGQAMGSGLMLEEEWYDGIPPLTARLLQHLYGRLLGEAGFFARFINSNGLMFNVDKIATEYAKRVFITLSDFYFQENSSPDMMINLRLREPVWISTDKLLDMEIVGGAK